VGGNFADLLVETGAEAVTKILILDANHERTNRFPDIHVSGWSITSV
jgi:hypothetical protein